MDSDNTETLWQSESQGGYARTIIKVLNFEIEIVAEDPILVSWLQKDYPHQGSSPAPALRVLVAYRTAAPLKGPFVSPRSRWKSFGRQNRALFFGNVSVEYSYTGGFALICGKESHSVYEVLEMTLSTFLGEKADGLGCHRVHGLGVSLKNRAVLVLGKSGAGKTTLGSELCTNPEINFFSDDTPWVDRRGRLHSFAHRFSFKTMPAYPQNMVRRWQRPRHGLRFLVHSDLLTGRWESPLLLNKLFLLERTSKPGCQRVGRLRVFIWLCRWLVVGLETPQIFELRVRFERNAIARGFYDLSSRLYTALRLAWMVPAYRLAYQPGEKASLRLLEQLQ